MSTEPSLSIARCFEEMYPSATDHAPRLTILSPVLREMNRLPIKQLVSKLHERLSHGKKKTPPKVMTRLSTHQRILLMKEKA